MPDYRADEVADQAYDWLKRHRSLVIAVVGVVVVVAAVLVLSWVQENQRLEQASRAFDNLPQPGPERAVGLEKLIREYPNAPVAVRARLELADAFYVRGKYKEAEHDYRLVLDDPKTERVYRSRARLGLAYTTQQSGDYAGARKLFEAVLKDGLYVAEAGEMLKLLENPATLPPGVQPGAEVSSPSLTQPGTTGVPAAVPTAPQGYGNEVTSFF